MPRQHTCRRRRCRHPHRAEPGAVARRLRGALTGNAATLWRWVSQGEGDLVITDVVMPDENAFDMLPRIKKMRPELPVIVMSAQNTFMTAIRASERGAYEYLPKPFDLTELLVIVVPRAGRAEGRRPSAPRRRAGETMPLVGRSPAMQDIYRVLARLMQTDLTVMISGESGTGKELVARALHDYGKRRNGPFVAINMAAIPRDLIESELFGHEKGAFTGATPAPPAASSRPRAARCSSTRSATCRWRRRPAAARAAAGRIHHRRRPHPDQDRCAHRRGHQQGPAHR
jgi:DNA-binding NtrC family response regulator